MKVVIKDNKNRIYTYDKVVGVSVYDEIVIVKFPENNLTFDNRMVYSVDIEEKED